MNINSLLVDLMLIYYTMQLSNSISHSSTLAYKLYKETMLPQIKKIEFHASIEWCIIGRLYFECETEPQVWGEMLIPS